ncbi:hypothetical protein AGLY_013143 [Aphis glycines]|uniref:Uncharacterized protein n=1 Tax=Aphis glycines TaxID=307491 RepID=A0A6G0T7M2_APHGL|nr:hypothetical protein AGLY_013143 [Aphis glycines]
MIMCDGYSTAQDSQLDKNKLSLESSTQLQNKSQIVDGPKNAVFNSLLKFCKHECLEHSNIPTKVPKNGELLKNKNENMQLCKLLTLKCVNQKCREHTTSDLKLCVIFTHIFRILDDCYTKYCCFTYFKDMMCSRIMKVSHGIIGRQRELTSSFSRFRGGLYHPVVRRLSSVSSDIVDDQILPKLYTVKNKYINQEMHRRIMENKAKFPVKKEIKMKPKEVYKSKAEFGPSYAQQLQQTCVVIAVVSPKKLADLRHGCRLVFCKICDYNKKKPKTYLTILVLNIKLSGVFRRGISVHIEWAIKLISLYLIPYYNMGIG